MNYPRVVLEKLIIHVNEIKVMHKGLAAAPPIAGEYKHKQPADLFSTTKKKHPPCLQLLVLTLLSLYMPPHSFFVKITLFPNTAAMLMGLCSSCSPSIHLCIHLAVPDAYHLRFVPSICNLGVRKSPSRIRL